MSQPIYLNVYWHQHQPWYFKPESKYALMPWVRLHGVKDYYDMAGLCNEFSGWKQTVNLVPSLLRQIKLYTDEGATDQYLELSRKAPADLTTEEKRTALDFLFHGHAPRMILPYPRYDELYHKRGNSVDDAIKRFSDQDILDLQVWFNLTWIDPVWRNTPDSPLKAIEDKQRGFNEDDKKTVLDYHQKILEKIIPVHADLTQQGVMDLTCTPYYHPILPLLCDSQIATVSNPHDPVPDPAFAHQEDADRQIKMGLDYFESCFGYRPQGMWPSEGSVSDHALELIAKNGVSFAATDENILFRSEMVNRKALEDRQTLYQLHQLQTRQGDIDLIFRDHELSDLIGFVYHRMPPKEAANDFIKRIKQAVDGWNQKQPPLINVILDGENCWEFYENDGHDFLRYWIEGILADKQIVPATVPEYRKEYPSTPSLKSIFPGSWINNNFRIWIGHPEDNAAWHHLRQVRDELVKRENQLDEQTREAAWNQLYICEGSDWFWWYGDENSSELDWLFDQLFREHLIHLYKLIDIKPPNALYRSIKNLSSPDIVDGGIFFQQPQVTGTQEGYYEWMGARRISAQNEGGAMQIATTDKNDVRIGRYHSNLCFLIHLENHPSSQIKRIGLVVSKPSSNTIELSTESEHSQIKSLDHTIEGCVNLSEHGIEQEHDLWFSFWLQTDDGKDFTIPANSEIYLQSYTPATSSVYWFI